MGGLAVPNISTSALSAPTSSGPTLLFPSHTPECTHHHKAQMLQQRDQHSQALQGPMELSPHRPLRTDEIKMPQKAWAPASSGSCNPGYRNSLSSWNQHQKRMVASNLRNGRVKTSWISKIPLSGYGTGLTNTDHLEAGVVEPDELHLLCPCAPLSTANNEARGQEH